MDSEIIAQRLDLGGGKGLVDAFEFLQADDVGCRLAEPVQEVGEPLTNRVDVPGRDAQHDQTEKLVPQPHAATAFGLTILKAEPIRSSTKSSSEPPIY